MSLFLDLAPLLPLASDIAEARSMFADALQEDVVIVDGLHIGQTSSIDDYKITVINWKGAESRQQRDRSFSVIGGVVDSKGHKYIIVFPTVVWDGIAAPKKFSAFTPEAWKAPEGSGLSYAMFTSANPE